MDSPALELLLRCAKAFDAGNLQLADDLLKRIWNLADDESNEKQSKVVKYFAEALVRRAYQLHSTISFVNLHLHPPFVPVYISKEFWRVIDNGKKKLHLIDFWLPEESRYEGIIDAFDVVRVSVILPVFLKNISYVRNKIEEFITEHNEIELKEVYANNLGEVDLSILDLERREDEAVVVLYSYKLHKLIAEPGAMKRELSKLGQIKPDIVIIEEADADHNDSNFLVRLKNSFQYYSDALRVHSLQMEKYQRREIHNIVGCEGRDRIIRHQTLDQWRSHLLAAVFRPISCWDQYRLPSYLHKDGECLVTTTRSRSIRFTSFWELRDSEDHFNRISDKFEQAFDPSLPAKDMVQPLQFDQKAFYLNQLAAFAEIYDMLEEVCLRNDLPKALTWACGANVSEIMSDPCKKQTLLIQSTFCYSNGYTWLDKDRHQQMQFMVEKALQSSEHFHFEKNLPLSDNGYEYEVDPDHVYVYDNWFLDHAAVAICLQNNHNIDDVYVVEFFLPKIETELQETISLALRIFNDFKNMKKKFVRVRSQLKGLNEQEGVIPNFQTPLPISPPMLHEQGSREPTFYPGHNLLKKQSAKRIGQKAQSAKRRKSSSVWHEFTEKQDGVGNIRAVCAHCGKDFDGSSKKGTTHLRNHSKSCKLRAAKVIEQLTVPIGRGDSKNENAHEVPSSFDPPKIGDSTTRDTNERNSMFDQERSRLDFARMIIKHRYPLDMAEQEYFRTFLKNLQSEFEFQSREIILSHIDRIYVEEKEKLHRYFNQLACNFSLTISLWKDNLGKNAYCCLIAHFIDDDWELRKKILAYKSVEHIYDTGILTGIIRSSISEWNMGSKICSITMDNSSFNDDMVQQIKENCLNDQGSLLSRHFFIGCSLISDGFREIYDKLDGALKSREIFCQLEKIDDSFRLNPSMEEWDKVVALHGCLKGFHDILSSLEGTQTLTSNLYFYKLCNIYKKFLHLEKSNYPFVRLMKGKFDCYWSLCNLVFAVAAVLDPRLKFEFVEFSYNEIYGRESQMQWNRFHKVLTDVYYEYANKYSRNLTTSDSAFGDSSTRQNTQVAHDCILDAFSKFESANKFKRVASWKSELDRYLDEMRLPLDGEFFDILQWWRVNSERFPTLGRMARDLLAIPVSVVPPCSNFSDPAYSKLNAGDMEALMCSQNWLEMEKERQPMFPDNEAPRNEDLTREATIWTWKDVRAYLVSPFTDKDFEHLTKWQDLAISGENVGPDKIPGKALAPLLRIPPYDVDLKDARSYYIEDTVVNQFFILLKRRYKRFPHEYLKHYSFDSCTATFLIKQSKSEDEVLSWVKQEDLKGVRKVFLPMCLYEHWLLFYADIDNKKLLWLDSNEHSRMSNVSEKQVIRRWFLEFLLPSMGHDQKDWSFDIPNDIPLQKNSVDCALFVMKYADCLTHGNFFPFSQEDMAHFRYRTFVNLCLGTICAERSQDGTENYAQQKIRLMDMRKGKRKIGDNGSTFEVKIPKNLNSEEDSKSIVGNAKDCNKNDDNPSLDGWLKSAESAGETASSPTSVIHIS